MATQALYVVCKQIKNNIGVIVNQVVPDKAFLDYPPALAYAQTIFVKNFMNNDMSARDLVYLLDMPTSSPTSVITPVTS